MNRLCELLEAERPVIPDTNADYYIGYNNGLVMAQAIVQKRDVVEVVPCKDCVHRKEKVCANPSAGMWVGVELKDSDFCSYGERRAGE